MKPENLRDKFFHQQCTTEEAEVFIRWYFSDKGEEEINKQIEKYWTSGKQTDWDGTAVFDRIQSAKSEMGLFVSHNADADKDADVVRSRHKRNRVAWQVAASILLVLGMSFWFFNPSNREPAPGEVAMIEKTNPSGQKSTIHLKDGSRITLNSSSSVLYPENFAENERVIVLQGEAFFEVAKDSRRPFRVKTANTVTTALGTSFNINAFDGENEIKIGLATGKIEVKSTGLKTDQVFELTPGQGVVFSRKDSRMEQTTVNIDQILAWTSKELIFDKEEFGKVIKRLERWYGVEISVEGTVDGVFSASFKNQSLNAVLEGLSYSFMLDYQISDKKVTLKVKS
ncbi:MAG: FecR domain-containing protein [Cyclobacteriaceae bacterium]